MEEMRGESEGMGRKGENKKGRNGEREIWEKRNIRKPNGERKEGMRGKGSEKRYKMKRKLSEEVNSKENQVNWRRCKLEEKWKLACVQRDFSSQTLSVSS